MMTVIFRNFGYDYEVASNLADLELGIASLLYPLVFAFTHPEINKKYFKIFRRISRKNSRSKISPSVKSTIGDRQLILTNEQEAQVHFEQLHNQWK
uniref:Uncharacterized protein n=1 Tax=Panagrolaimus sp. JU765 TaxID=591449 RepID=A0AC34RMJ2_9BILA